MPYTADEVIRMISCAKSEGVHWMKIPGYEFTFTVAPSQAKPATAAPKSEPAPAKPTDDLQARRLEKLAEIVTPFWKYEGRMLHKIPRKDLHDYLTFLWKGSTRADWSVDCLAWLDAADEYLELEQRRA